MTEDVLQRRDAIIEAALPSIPFDGWSMATLEQAAAQAGYEPAMARAVFPGGVTDALDHFSDWTDRAMLAQLPDPESLRVRDRIRAAVLARLEVLEPYREAEKLALAHWSRLSRGVKGSRLLWRTADRIWVWAGDTATDYNHYTKRMLLSGVIGATLLAWLNDDTAGRTSTASFLDRRIENVMRLGQFIGKLKKAH